MNVNIVTRLTNNTLAKKVYLAVLALFNYAHTLSKYFLVSTTECLLTSVYEIQRPIIARAQASYTA